MLSKPENGLLSYENPNYHMDPQRIERNSHLYEEILSELQQQSNLRTSAKHMVSNRKDYARMDISSMGVDLKENFTAADKQLMLDDQSPTESKTKSDQIPEKSDDDTKLKKDNSNTGSNAADDGIKYISGNLNSDDLYALPNKRKQNNVNELSAEDEQNVAVNEIDDDEEEKGRKEDIEGIEDKDANKDLPPGWEKHEG